jgi:hypothetical protein
MLLVGALALGAALAGARGRRLLALGLREGSHPSAALWIVRGIRGVAVSVALVALTAGLLSGQAWLLVFGAIFLAEELYETGVLAVVLRLAPGRSPATGGLPGPRSPGGSRVDSATSQGGGVA